MTDNGCTDTDRPAGSSAAQSSGSPSSSSPLAPAGTLYATVISLTTIAIITYAWFSGRLALAPWWAAPAGIVIAAIPGGAMAGVLGQVGRAALDKIPGRSK